MWVLANFILFRFLYNTLYFGFWEISISKNKTRWLTSALNFLLLLSLPTAMHKEKKIVWFISFTSITCNKSSPNALCFVSLACRVKGSGVIFGLASGEVISLQLYYCAAWTGVWCWGVTPPVYSPVPHVEHQGPEEALMERPILFHSSDNENWAFKYVLT